jgi:hypothetical protein
MTEIFVKDAFLKGLYNPFPNLEILIFLKENPEIFLKMSKRENRLFTSLQNEE